MIPIPTWRHIGVTRRPIIPICLHVSTSWTSSLEQPQRRSAEVVEVVGPSAGRKYATELIGTFLFLFTIAAAVPGTSSFAPLAIGAVLMVMIYAGEHRPRYTQHTSVTRRYPRLDCSPNPNTAHEDFAAITPLRCHVSRRPAGRR